jgi:exosortase H (IPTLxxWG-CTERM-specific)
MHHAGEMNPINGEKKIHAPEKKEKGRENPGIRRFLITYLALIIVFFFFTSFKPVLKIIDVNGFFTQFVVIVASKILCAVHDQCVANGSVITLPALSLDVGAACSGLDAVMMYSVAILAYPARWKKRFIGIAAGFLIIQTANMLRIVALSYIGIYMKGIFEFIHIYIAQGIMIALALGIFLVYLNYANKPETERS